MRFRLFTTLLCAFVFAIHADAVSYEEYNRLMMEIAPLDSMARVSVEEKDYAKSADLYQRILVKLTSADEELVSVLQDVLSGSYYNLACYRSLLGQKDAALLALYNAYKYGYNDYKHMMTDTDLDPVRDMEGYESVFNKIKSIDFGVQLADAAAYKPDSLCPRFHYADASDKRLCDLRNRLNLDSVAGSGDEVSRIKNLTRFVHEYIRHNGSHPNPQPFNGLAFIDSCADGRGTLNCRGMAMLLNECMLAMGYPSRYITCYPKTLVNDCHVINTVYSRQLGRWIWMDPSFGAWVMDEDGNLLGIKEVRERIIAGRPVVLNDEADHYDNKTTKDWYIDYYMTKNLYAIEAQKENKFGAEDNGYSPWESRTYVGLVPSGFTASYLNGIVTSDDNAFWSAPE